MDEKLPHAQIESTRNGRRPQRIVPKCSKKQRMVIIASHPIQYKVPLYRRLTERGRIDLEVLYKSRHGVEPSYSRGLGREVRFDVELLEGYSYTFLDNWGAGRAVHPPWGQVNPSVLLRLDPSAYDVAVLNGYSYVTDWMVAAVAQHTGLPYLLRAESTLMFSRPLGRRFIRETLVRILVRRAAGALAIGKKNQEFYRHYGKDLSLHWAPYSVDNKFFQSRRITDPERLASVAESYDLDYGPPIICFCGKHISRKRPGDLIEAIDRIGNEDVQALVVGSGPLTGSLKSKVDRAGLSSRVRLPGFVNHGELSKIYSLADVLVLPSEKETWGLVVNEAMNFGVPAITTDQCGCAYDLVDEGKTGFVVSVGDVEMLSKRIKDVLAMIERKGDEVEAAVLTKVSQYSLDRTAEGFEEAAEFVAGLR